jgi:2-polyprenyl-6-methoxyphenol hydroxylase-like FAD-dependent oxidoreductase
VSANLTRTPVGIVGGGPAGLMLSHLLAGSGIDSVVVELRTREEIEHTHRAGILEQDSVRMLVETGVSDRVLRDGYRHEGIELARGTGSTSSSWSAPRSSSTRRPMCSSTSRTRASATGATCATTSARSLSST